MSVQHSPEQKAVLMERFRERLARLNKAVENDYPGAITCSCLKLCLYSAIALYGDCGAGIVADMLLAYGREYAGLCPFCGVGPLVIEKGMCEPCWKEAGDDDAEAAKAGDGA